MKSRRRLLRPPGYHILGQEPVESKRELGPRYVRPRLKGDYLAQSMHPCVRSARRKDPYLLTSEQVQGLLNFRLHGTNLGLNLPATEIRTVVLQLGPDDSSRHDTSSSRAIIVESPRLGPVRVIRV